MPVRSVVCSLVVMLALALGAVAVLAPLATAASSAGQHPQGSERPSTLTDGTWPGTQGPRAASQYTGYPYRNAPECTAGTYRCVADQWLFFQGQCTSWVAYRLNELNGIAFTNSYGGAGNWGDATKWGSHAGTLGVDVNGTPAVGAVAWYSWGHVAYVEKVNSLTSVDISEMNYDNANGLRVRTITTASAWPSGFIHIKDLKVSDRPHNETFVQVTGQGQVSPVADEAGLLVSPATALAPSQPDPGLSAQQIDRPPHPGGHRPPVASGPVTTYDLRYERAPYGGPFTAWVTPAPWQGLPTTGVGVGLSPGYDYCFQARVHNTVGPWSPPRCAAEALDDRAASSHSTGWTLVSSPADYQGTATQTTISGATWTRTGVQLDHVGVLTTVCPTCGRVSIFLNGSLLGSMSLYSATVHYQTMQTLTPFTYRTGTLVIKVTSATGRLVQIDGVLTSRT